MGSQTMLVHILMMAVLMNPTHQDVQRKCSDGKQSFSVALGYRAILSLPFQIPPEKNIDKVSWEFKEQSLYDNDVGPPEDPRMSVDKHGTLLMITDIKKSDYGKYTVTVRLHNGEQMCGIIEVLQSETLPEAVLALQCDMLTNERFSGDPVFSWLLDGVKITSGTHGNLSADGSKLYLSGRHGQNYTCIINSSLGESTASYLMKTDGTDSSSTYIIVIVFLTVALLVSIVFNIRRCRRRRNGAP